MCVINRGVLPFFLSVDTISGWLRSGNIPKDSFAAVMLLYYYYYYTTTSTTTNTWPTAGRSDQWPMSDDGISWPFPRSVGGARSHSLT